MCNTSTLTTHLCALKCEIDETYIITVQELFELMYYEPCNNTKGNCCDQMKMKIKEMDCNSSCIVDSEFKLFKDNIIYLDTHSVGHLVIQMNKTCIPDSLSCYPYLTQYHSWDRHQCHKNDCLDLCIAITHCMYISNEVDNVYGY